MRKLERKRKEKLKLLANESLLCTEELKYEPEFKV